MKKTQLMKVGYAAEAPQARDLAYWANLAAELTDLWTETRRVGLAVWDSLKTIWNLGVQIVQLVTALIPVVRTVAKKWLDFVRANTQK
jgi:hypothetical protein